MAPSIRTLALLAVVLALSGCALTKNRYEKGVQREAAGRYAEAFEAYWKVVNKDPGYADAAERLEQIGADLIAAAWDEAHTAADAERYEDAARALERMQRWHARAAAVGIALPLPDGYADYRREIEASAMHQWVERGRVAEGRGDWPAALRAYEQALSYPLTDRQRHDLDLARASVLLRWGEDDLAAGHPRAAFDRAAQAIDLLPPDAANRRPLQALQDEALRVGTRVVAFVPFGASEDVRRQTRRDFLAEFNDVLLVDYWTRPPLFIAPFDPITLRRELRRLNVDPGRLSDRMAAQLGRDLGADFVVVGEITEITREEGDRREEIREARTRGRGVTDTTYVIERYDLELEAEVRFALVDPGSRRVVHRGRRTARVEDRFERGRYDGDLNRLRLDRDALRYFDREALREQEHALENALIDELADRVAEAVFEAVLERIP